MPTIEEVIAWKLNGTAEFARQGNTFILWEHATEPEPDAATLTTWASEYTAAGAEHDAEIRRAEASRAFRALVLWVAQLHGLTPAQARDQLRTILAGLP